MEVTGLGNEVQLGRVAGHAIHWVRELSVDLNARRLIVMVLAPIVSWSELDLTCVDM